MVRGRNANYGCAILLFPLSLFVSLLKFLLKLKLCTHMDDSIFFLFPHLRSTLSVATTLHHRPSPARSQAAHAVRPVRLPPPGLERRLWARVRGTVKKAVWSVVGHGTRVGVEGWFSFSLESLRHISLNV